jgi:hypothetical protein
VALGGGGSVRAQPPAEPELNAKVWRNLSIFASSQLLASKPPP